MCSSSVPPPSNVGRELVGVLVEPDVELAAELVELQARDQPAICAAPHGPLVAVLVGDRARLAKPLDLTAGDLHPEGGATAELEHLDAVGAGLVHVRRVGRHEEPVARVQHLRPHLQRTGDDVVEAVAVVGVARQHVVRTEPGAHEAEAVVALAAVHDRVVGAGDEVRRARTVGGEHGAIVGVEFGRAHGPRLEETRRVLAPEQLDALLVGHGFIVAHRVAGTPVQGRCRARSSAWATWNGAANRPGDAGVGPPLLEHRAHTPGDRHRVVVEEQVGELIARLRERVLLRHVERGRSPPRAGDALDVDQRRGRRGPVLDQEVHARGGPPRQHVGAHLGVGRGARDRRTRTRPARPPAGARGRDRPCRAHGRGRGTAPTPRGRRRSSS